MLHSATYKLLPLWCGSLSLMTEVTHVAPLVLHRDTYKLWPLWVWLYCIVWWLIQDCIKVSRRKRV